MYLRYDVLRAGCLSLIVAWTSSAYACAELTSRIATVIASDNKNNRDYPITRTVKILTPESQLATLCVNPLISLTGSSQRLTGNRSVIAQCGARRKFIQVIVQAEGTWWTATHNIPPGTPVLRDDIQPHTGSLEHLPADVQLDPLSIIGHVPTREIRPGSPITANQLRKRPVIVYGQKVDVIAQGPGFRIRTSGKAMANATENSPLHVQTLSGRVLTGTADVTGLVIINMNE
ncbi:hypothetical protein VL10_09225 [Leclercia adecarboxylata]|nr:hypothetical protein VL10_09225 [Leclercia adecarboxylata]KMN61728.1 hypothetical protein VK95_22895 [Leclercia sp. LK8]